MNEVFAVDVDGVVADLHSEWIGRYNHDYYDNVRVSDIDTWDMRDHVKPEAKATILKYLQVPGLYDTVQPIHGALEGVFLLRQMGYKVVFVSACPINGMDMKVNWLVRHGFMPADDMMQTGFIAACDKNMIRADYLLDDNLATCINFHGRAIIFDQPWNQPPKGRCLRLRGWEFISLLIDKLQAQHAPVRLDF